MFLFSGMYVRAQAGLDAPEPVGAFFNGVFPEASPGGATGWTTELAFPQLRFVDPLWLTEIPGTDQLLLVGKNGQISRFRNDESVGQSEVVQVLDWTAWTETNEDQGMYSLAFHPNFGEFGAAGRYHVFVCYSRRARQGIADAERSYWRVSRFTWVPSTGKIDPASEMPLISQYDPHDWHNGGAMFFGGDGFLYVTNGDGGGGSDSYNTSQRLDWALMSGMFRIDVDNDPSKSHPIRRQPVDNPGWNRPADLPASFTQGYGIPNDNPFLDPSGSILEEYYALGLRSPHSAHLDPPTGEIWVGDVGQGSREELTRVLKGSNCQWGYREGIEAGPKPAPSPMIGTEEPPVHDYSHSEGAAIIAGMRYRGEKWATQLGGKVLFGDHVRGRIWTLDPDSVGPVPKVEEIVPDFPTGFKAGLVNFCSDSSGEIFLMNPAGPGSSQGSIRRLVAESVTAEPPRYLSQTGVFTDLETLETAAGVMPYEVASPLWSDGAHKRRWVILPNDGTFDSADERIVFDELGPWLFPEGTVLVKHFEMPLDASDPSLRMRLETRFIVCTANGGKYGVTYRWNAAGTDAELMSSGAEADYEVRLENGAAETRRWSFPSRSDCLQCHNEGAGQALGFKTSMLNRTRYYAETDRVANQIATLNALGIFDRSLTQSELADLIEARPLDDESAPLEHRVRSYLDSNCAHCHQPGGLVESFDARLEVPLSSQGIINGLLEGRFDLGEGGHVVSPGDTALSAVHARMTSDGADSMPPLGKSVVDERAVELIGQWIAGLTPDEFEATATPKAKYVRLRAYSEVLGSPFTSVAEFGILDGNGELIPVNEMSIGDVDSEEPSPDWSPAAHAIDGNPSTIWHTAYSVTPWPKHPHHITINLGTIREIGGFIYVPRQDMANGRISRYEVSRSLTGTNWSRFDSGVWPNGTAAQRFDQTEGARAVRCDISGPAGPVRGAFDVTVVFDSEVEDFADFDISLNGGEIVDFRGGGYYYVVTIMPNRPMVTVSVPARVVDPFGDGSQDSPLLAIPYDPTLPAEGSYEAWAAGFGLDGSVGAIAADDDRDGLGQLVEFAFGLNPQRADYHRDDAGSDMPSGLPRSLVVEHDGRSLLALSFLRRRDAGGLAYEAQFGDAPDLFEAGGTVVSVDPLGLDWERVTVADTLSPADAPRRFGRVAVSSADP